MSEPTPPSRSHGVASAAVLLGLGNVSSRLLGLVREQVIAALYGATGATSAFRTSTRVSTAVYDLLLSGATTSALIPVFTDYADTEKSDDLSRILSTFVNLTLLGLGAVVAILAFFAPWLVTILGADAEHFDLAVELTRIALPSIPLLGVAGILTAALYARRSFRVPAFSPAIYNLGIIATAVLLAGTWGIHGLALGLAVGASLQILVQAPALRGVRYHFILDLTHPGVRLVFRLYTPVFVGMLASYAVVVLDTNLAWRTGADSVAAMAFATTLIQFPLGLVGAAASLAILPTLTRLASPDSGRAFDETLMQGLRLVVFLIVPVGVVMVVLREPIVSILFERRSFDAIATERTALALLAYAPQLPFVVVDQILIVSFYARKITMTPVVVGVMGVLVYLAVALATIEPLGMPGLALANAVQNSMHAVILYLLLARDRPRFRSPAVGTFLLQMVAAALACAVSTTAMMTALGSLLDGSALWVRVAGLALAGLVGLAGYVLAVTLLRLPELRSVRELIRGLLLRR